MKNCAKLSKIIILFIMLILCSAMLFSCKTDSTGPDDSSDAKTSNAININLKDLAKVISEKVDLSEDIIEYSPDQIKTYYGISDENAAQIVVIKKLDISNISNAEVLILVEALDKDKAKEIENNLKEHKTYKLNELLNYNANPDNERQYYIVEGADIIVNQQYVFWAVYPETKEINNIISEYIKNNNK